MARGLATRQRVPCRTMSMNPCLVIKIEMSSSSCVERWVFLVASSILPHDAAFTWNGKKMTPRSTARERSLTTRYQTPWIFPALSESVISNSCFSLWILIHIYRLKKNNRWVNSWMCLLMIYDFSWEWSATLASYQSLRLVKFRAEKRCTGGRKGHNDLWQQIGFRCRHQQHFSQVFFTNSSDVLQL